MPVTAKLSRKFYDALGDEIANELVEWFNAVDATYRSDLRDLNELNFQRFDARQEQRAAELEMRLDGRLTEFEVRMERRLTSFEMKMERRLGDFEMKMERRLGESGKETGRRVGEFEMKVERRLAECQVGMERSLSRLQRTLLRWMFVFWVPTALATIGLFLKR